MPQSLNASPMHDVDGFNPDFVAALPVQRLASGGALYVAGPAPARLLFVHGGFHGAWCFGSWMDVLSRNGIGSAALDFPGHGFLAGEALPLSTGIAAYAASVREAAAATADGICVVGHSLGALAVASAAAHIDASAIVLLAPSPPANLPGAMRVPSRSVDGPVPVPLFDEAIERFLGGARPLWANRFHRLLCSESPAALNDRYKLRVPVDPATLPSKTLVIAAGRDDVVRHPQGQDAAIAALYRAGYLMLDDAPHCMMLGDGSITVLDSILAWLTPG
jgi:hypothetical protein